jgi:hypothetical protein
MMWINNEKNGTQGGTTNHTALHSEKCLIRELTRSVHHIMTHEQGSPDNIISTYFAKGKLYML